MNQAQYDSKSGHANPHTPQRPPVAVHAKDLPVYCPNPSMPRWSAHPRVFIDITHGEARCPYCGTLYTLKPGEVIKDHTF